MAHHCASDRYEGLNSDGFYNGACPLRTPLVDKSANQPTVPGVNPGGVLHRPQSRYHVTEMRLDPIRGRECRRECKGLIATSRHKSI